MEEKITTSKIIVESSHELTDLVRDIHRSKADRIVLTFTEHTDILISPINLKVLLEAAQREEKLLIAQIIQNPTGIRNAKLAGIKTVDTPSNPTDYDWEDAKEMVQIKKREKFERKKILETSAVVEDQKEVFEEKVEQEIEGKQTKQYEDKRGIRTRSDFIAIDEDIPAEKPAEVPTIVQKATLSPKSQFKSISIKQIGRLNLLEKFKGLNKKKFLKISLFIFLPLLLLSALGFLLYNQFGTFVKVKIFVESKPVEIESILVGDEGIEEIDFENSKIPIKKDEETKSLSDTITATGKAYKGEKAQGKIMITYWGACGEETPKISLAAGHSVTANGKTYKLVNAVEFPCDQVFASDVPIIAENIGEEYNLASGQTIAVVGYTADILKAKNTTALTGGTKEEYSVLSQLDIDNAVESLSTTAIEEVKSALRETSGGWEIIENTILSEVDKSSIKTDKKVGEEATSVNLDLTIKGTATYYQTKGLAEKLTTLLREKAEEENLFESEKDLELVLGDEINKEITVEESTKDTVKIKILASSNIKPKIDKEQLVDELKGLSWEEGREYVDSLKYAEREAEVTFNPMNYPAFLKRFPERRGGILISIVELEVEE
jgi:hypothetical protein